MAGYQDQLIAPAPYRETIPVDAYTRVGMIKQQQYDQGIEKVQGMIDSVSGIEALMPEQKDYLNKAIGQLQSKVTTLASADFSNQQIVNSVGHLTGEIAADPIVQNTIYSTNAYRNESQKMKQAQEAGKSSPSNEYVFHRDFSNWLKSGDPTRTMNATYTPYTDYKGKMVKALNDNLARTPDEMITEMPYMRGKDGKVLLNENGMPVYDYNTLIEKYKGVDANKIRNIIDSSLDENDKQQMAIDGQYEYRGAGKPQLKEVTDRSYQSRLDQINGAIQGLQTKRAVSQSDPEALKNIDTQISQLSNAAEDHKKAYLRDIDNIDKDPEGYKSSLYAQNWLSQFSEGYSYAQHSLTYGENPGFKNALAEKEQAQKWEEFKLNKELGWANYGLEREKFDFEKQKAGLGGIGGAAGNLSTREPIDNPDVTTTLNKFVDDVNEQKKQVDLLDIALLASKNPELVERKFDDKGNAYFAWKGDTKQQQDANALAGQSALYKYRTDPGTGDIDIETWKTNTEGLRANYKAGMKAANDAQTQADKVPELNLNTRLGGVSNLSFRGADGVQYNVGAKDMVNSFSRKLAQIDKVSNTDVSIGAVPGASFLESYLSHTVSNEAADNAAQRLFTTPAEKAMWGAVKRYKENYPNVNPEDEKVVQRLNAVQKLGSDVADRRDAYTVNVLKNVLPAFQPVSTPLEQFKGPDKKAANVWATNQYVGLDADKLTGLNYNKKDVATMLGKANIENTSIFIVDRGNNKISMRLENPDVIGGKKMEIDLPQGAAENLLGGKFGVDAFKNIRNMQRYSSLSDGPITTNVLRGGAETATPLNNGNIQGYKVKYDVEQASSGQGQMIKLYVYDETTKTNKSVVLNPGVPLSESQVIAALQHISNDTIKAALKDQPAH